MDPAFLFSFFTSGADLARQQLAFLQNEFGKTYRMQHQPAPVNPVHVPRKKVEDEGRDENEEEQRKSACREYGPAVQGSRAMVSGLQGMTQVKEIETSSLRLENEMKVEADRSARRKIEIRAEMCKKDPVHFEEVCCRVEKMERGKTQITCQKNCQVKDPRTSKENSQGIDEKL